MSFRHRGGLPMPISVAGPGGAGCNGAPRMPTPQDPPGRVSRLAWEHLRSVAEDFDRAPDAHHRAAAGYRVLLARHFRHLIPADASVLEVGCGNGELLRHLPNRDITGIDVSACQAPTEASLRTFDIVSLLKIQPKTFSGSEKSTEPKRRVRGDGSPALDDLCQVGGGNARGSFLGGQTDAVEVRLCRMGLESDPKRRPCIEWPQVFWTSTPSA